MTEGSITRPIASLWAAFAVGYLLTMLTFVIDRKFVGTVGTASLAALGSAHAALMVLVTFALGMAVGTLAGVARHIGAGEPDQASRFAVNGLWIGLAFGLVMLGAAFVVPGPILAAMGSDPEVAGPAARYLAITMGGLALHSPLIMATFALQGAGLARVALVLTAVPAVLTVLVEWPLIFVLGWGLDGAAWGGVTAHAVGLLLALVLLSRSPLRPRSTNASGLAAYGRSTNASGLAAYGRSTND